MSNTQQLLTSYRVHDCVNGHGQNDHGQNDHETLPFCDHGDHGCDDHANVCVRVCARGRDLLHSTCFEI